MKDKILEIISKVAPTALSSCIKKQDDIMQYIEPLCGDTLSEKIYNAAYEPEIVCQYNNNKKFISFTKGYGYCGKAGTCKCAKEFISNRQKELKPKTSIKNIDKIKMREDVSNLSTPNEVKEFITTHSNGYESTIKAFNRAIYSEILTWPKDNTEHTFNIRAWHYINQIENILICTCGVALRFVNVFEGYKSECRSCYKQRIKDEGIINTKIKTQSLTAPICSYPTCNNTVDKNKQGIWNKHCSNKCKGQHNSLIGQSKSKQTLLSKYGVEHALQSKEILEKMYTTNLEKYNAENVGTIITNREKAKKTMLEKYGVDNATKLPEVRQKIVDAAAIRLGYKAGQFVNLSQIPEIYQKKMHNRSITKDYIFPSGNVIKIQGYEDKAIDLLLKSYDEQMFSFGTNYEYYYDDLTRNYFPDFEVNELVIEIKSSYTLYSEYEKNIEKFKSVVNKHNKDMLLITMIENNNKVFVPHFLPYNLYIHNILENISNYTYLYLLDDCIYDILLKDSKTLIKFIDPKFINEDIVDNDYIKNLNDVAKKNNFKLLCIDLYTLENNYNKILNVIKYKDNQFNQSLFARKCSINLVKPSDARKFYNIHHLQGFSTASYHIGLYYNRELVSCMSFSKFRPGIGKNRGDNAYELSRFASDGNVVGGASKLLKYFVKTYNPSLVYSYSDNMYSDGNLYNVLGFTLESELKPGYRYLLWNTTELLHRFNFSKSKLIKFENYDDNKTEKEIMYEAGYRRLYDAGKKTWILN